MSKNVQMRCHNYPLALLVAFIAYEFYPFGKLK